LGNWLKEKRRKRMTTNELHEILDDENRKLTATENWLLSRGVFLDCRNCVNRKAGCFKDCKFYHSYKKEQTMSKEQIEEITMLCPFRKEGKCFLFEDGSVKCNMNCDMNDFAKVIYNAGYRKQSWISVDERLPTYEDGKVLIYTAYGISIAQKTTTNHWKGDNAIPKFITHWMPLPEPPKMKGGAE
jgi:hypothetical protein